MRKEENETIIDLQMKDLMSIEGGAKDKEGFQVIFDRIIFQIKDFLGD